MEPIEIEREEVLERIYSFRAEVWQHDGVSPDLFPGGRWNDEHDNHAIQWAIFRGEEIVAAARICTHFTVSQLPDGNLFSSTETNLLVASFNRLVVHPCSRGLGLARSLDDVRIERAKRLGCSSVFLTTSSDARMAALRRRGFSVIHHCMHPLFRSSVAMQLAL